MARVEGVPAPSIDIDSAAARWWFRFARNLLLALTDVVMISFAVALGYVLWASPVHQQSPVLYLELGPLLLLFVGGYARAGLYPGLGLGPIETLRRVTFVTTFGFLILAAISFVLKAPHLYSRVTFALAFALALAFVPFGRVALFYLAQKWRWWAEPVVVIGTGRRASRVMRDLRRASHLGYRPVAVVTCGPASAVPAVEFEGVPIAGALDRLPSLATAGIRTVFLEADQMQTRPVLDELQQCFHRVILLHELDDLPVEGVQVRNLATLVGIEYTNNLLRHVNQTAKRLLDVTVASLALLILSPFIVTSALLVLAIDGGPVLFHQSRPGRGGRSIDVPKIRTMRREADSELEEHLRANPAARTEWERRFKLRDDPRLIPVVGRFFRRFSIDELPQLISVIRGDMSLVGPRPFPEYHLEQFSSRFRHLRESVRPGITGWWQITIRSEGGIAEQEAFDTYYIRNWSVWFDLYVLGRTVMAVVSGRGAY